MGRLEKLKRQLIKEANIRVLGEDSGQSSIAKKSMEDESEIIKKATPGDFLRGILNTQELFNKISKKSRFKSLLNANCVF